MRKCEFCGTCKVFAEHGICGAISDAVTNEVCDIRAGRDGMRVKDPKRLAALVLKGLPTWRWLKGDDVRIGERHARKAVAVWLRLQVAEQEVDELRAKLGYCKRYDD